MNSNKHTSQNVDHEQFQDAKKIMLSFFVYSISSRTELINCYVKNEDHEKILVSCCAAIDRTDRE